MARDRNKLISALAAAMDEAEAETREFQNLQMEERDKARERLQQADRERELVALERLAHSLQVLAESVQRISVAGIPGLQRP